MNQYTKQAIAKYKPAETLLLPINSLSPLCKVFDDNLFIKIKESINKEGLLYPLLTYPVCTKDWLEDCSRDKDIFPPPTVGVEHLRIQCGNNRYFALKELGYTEVEVIIFDDVEEAQRTCAYLRKDKRWR